MNTCYILVGVSGSGKSTWIKNNKPDAYVVSADHYFYDAKGTYKFNAKELPEAHNSCLRRFVEAVNDAFANLEFLNPLEICVDNTNLSKDEILPYIRIAEAFGFRVVIVYFTICNRETVDFFVKRNTHNVPAYAIQRQLDKLRNPDFYDFLCDFEMIRVKSWDNTTNS